MGFLRTRYRKSIFSGASSGALIRALSGTFSGALSGAGTKSLYSPLCGPYYVPEDPPKKVFGWTDVKPSLLQSNGGDH